MNEKIEKAATALLVMDMQMAVLSRYEEAHSVVRNLVTAIAYARQRQIPVIYVVVGFRQGMPEVSDQNKTFSQAKKRANSADTSGMMVIHPDLLPLEGDSIVTKRRHSAFTGSDLEVLLRSLKIDHLVLSGVATGGVVLSTLREASDKDFRLTVLSDGCTDSDPEVHKVLTEKIFPTQANILTVAQWATS